MADYRDHHATIFLPASVACPVEAIRRDWDPVMAEQIAAHVTLAYPVEAPDFDVLVSRLRAAAAVVAPFRLQLGAVTCFDRPEEGVYVAVDDADGGCYRLRDQLLAPPFKAIEFPLHVTVVHPRTSSRGREFWEADRIGSFDDVFTVEEVTITAFDGMTWATIETVQLEGQVDANISV
jgi:hypothetical protein